jgi:hypothetical protein
METKVCRVCKIEKPIDDFGKRIDRPSRRAYCKACANAATHKRRKTEHGAELRAKYRRNRKVTGKTDARYIWAKMRISPRNKKIGFEITLDEFKEFFGGMSTCEYCGRTIDDFARDAAFIRDYTGVDRDVLKYKHMADLSAADVVRLTIDRRDSDGPYSKDNITACCWFCNFIKGRHIPHAAMKSIGPRMRADLTAAMHG